jgi:hypothetical protein
VQDEIFGREQAESMAIRFISAGKTVPCFVARRNVITLIRNSAVVGLQAVGRNPLRKISGQTGQNGVISQS